MCRFEHLARLSDINHTKKRFPLAVHCKKKLPRLEHMLTKSARGRCVFWKADPGESVKPRALEYSAL